MSFSSSTSSVGDRLNQIRQTLPDSVRLIAVTKQVSAEVVRLAYAAGVRDFGENRVQEAEAKQAQLQDLTDITWHLIGHLQSNKAAKALAHFQWIHSVDSLKLAQRLDQLAAELPQKPQVCLQIKVLPDPNKFGWNISELLEDVLALEQCQHLEIKGLMSIPPLGLGESETRSVFGQTRDLAAQIREQSRLPIQELSMGMSEDYQLAIDAGATLIRLGRTLFGDRS